MSEHSLAQAISQSVKALFDSVIHSDLIKRIPVMGPAVEVCETMDDIRARIFARKLIGFLQALDKMTPEAREKFTKKMADSQEEMQKVGETLLLVVEKITALDKARILAYVFIAYTQGHIEAKEFLRLCDAIDQAFIYDLQDLLGIHEAGHKTDADYMKHLTRTGLTFADPTKIARPPEDYYYKVSRLGLQLSKAYSQGNEYCRGQ